MSAPKFIASGEQSGAATYRTADGRWRLASTVSGRGEKRTRLWLVKDTTRTGSDGGYLAVAAGTTLAVCERRFAKYLALAAAGECP